MASRLARSILRTTKGRLYTTQAATAQADTQTAYVPSESPKVTKVNDFTVASVETYSPLSRISLVVRAGARYEPRSAIGVGHILRHTALLSNQETSGFKTVKVMHQTGGTFTVSSTREYIYYTCEFTRNHINTGLELLLDMVTSPKILEWEYPTISGQLEFDLAVLNEQPNVKLVELLHDAAYNDTLGQSLYCTPARLKTTTIKQIMDYMKTQYTASNIAVVGVGVDHKFLTDRIDDVKAFGEGTPETKPAHYLGGERRLEAAGPMTYAAVVTEGPSMHSKDLLSAGVLQMIMGTGPYVKYSHGIGGSKLTQAVAKATDTPFAISGMNANYTDSGLFGFVAAAKPEMMDTVLRAAVKEFGSVTKTGVTEQEVARGKNQLKASIAMMQESCEGVMMNLAEQAMGSDRVISLEEVSKMVDSVTVADVSAVAKKLVAGKPSMAAIGNLSNTPYLHELYK